MKPGERGYTLIELLVSISIVVAAGTAATAGIVQLVRNTERNGNHMAAVLEVQNADHRISRDVRMAQGVLTTDNLTSPEFLFLTWIDGNSGDEYRITYTLEEMAGSDLKKLLRNQTVNSSDNATSVVAHNIDADPGMTSCNLTDGVLNLKLTATVGRGATAESETRTYKVLPRPG